MAAWASEARHQPGPGRIAARDPNDWYCAAGAWAACAMVSLLTTITSGFPLTTSRAISAKALGPALAGIPLDAQVLSLDISQPAQLLEKRLIEADFQCR